MSIKFKVDYYTMVKVAEVIRGANDIIFERLNGIYGNVSKMNSCWKGERYKEVVGAFNGLVDPMNQMLQFLDQIPSIIEQIANIYKTADCGGEVSNVEIKTHKIDKLALPADTTAITFISSEVSTIKDDIIGKFGTIRDQIEALTKQITASGLVWEGNAADECKNALTIVKDNLCNTVNSISKQCGTLIENLSQNIEKTEVANTME